MKRYFLLSFALIITATTAFAQYIVEGCVTDSTNTGEPYATVRIFYQSSSDNPVKIGTTDINGHFKLELSSAGKYTLNITSVGKTPINKDFELSTQQKSINFGSIIMSNQWYLCITLFMNAQK